MKIEIREERSGDEAAIRAVNDQAFGQPREGRLVDAGNSQLKSSGPKRYS